MTIPKKYKELINQFELNTEYSYIDNPNWVQQIQSELTSIEYIRGNE